MKKIISAVFFAFSSLFFCLSVQAAAVQDMSFQKVQEILKQNPQQNVVIEFYSSTPSSLDSDNADLQAPIFAETALRFSSDVLFARVDINSAPKLSELGIVRILPTHLFIRHGAPQGQEVVAQTVRGFLSRQDLEELVFEFFQVKP